MSLRGRLLQGTVRALVESLPQGSLGAAANLALRFYHRAHERMRRHRISTIRSSLPGLGSWTGEALQPSVLERRVPWDRVEVPDCRIPGMLTEAEKRYYGWITGFCEGRGEVIEIGTWLGLSTFHIVHGLRRNPRFSGRLRCYDDFVWRSEWMDPWLDGSSIRAPRNHESFEALFRGMTSEISDLVVAVAARLAEFDGNDRVAPMTWSGDPVEMVFVDCGRLLAVNDAWYRLLRPSFLRDRTLLVLQDWQHHKAVPETWWEQMKPFTESKGSEIELVHEVRDGGIGTFLFRG